MHDSIHKPISGLGPGTMVLTLEGELPVEWLAAGDMVITRDNGAVPILHIHRLRRTPEGDMLPQPMTFLRGERGPAGALKDKLRVAPGHRGLIRHPKVAENFHTDEILARFCDVSRRNRVRHDPTMGGLTYHLLICENHEIINAGSLWVETTDGEMAARLDLPKAVRRATRIMEDGAEPPRLCLNKEEAQILRGAIPPGLSLLDMLSA